MGHRRRRKGVYARHSRIGCSRGCLPQAEPIADPSFLYVQEPTARRRGVAAQALLQAMKYGREAMGATSFVAKIIEGNAASVALFDSLGFRLAKRVAVFGELHYLLEDSEEK